MYQNRPRRFRRRPNGGKNSLHDNGARLRSNSFSNNQARNHFRMPQSAEKLFEKYNTLAKEALSSGDKTLSENYFQHADHFARIIGEKILNHKNHLSQQDPIKEKEIVTDESKTENVETNPKNIENNSGHNTK